MRRHFCEVLDVSDVGDDDSFFDLGGHSLLALELVQRLEDTFRHQFTVASLYESPTPRAVAAALIRWVGHERPGHEQQYEYLLPIQTQGSRPPLFGVHVLGQNAIFYRPLSEHLGPDQPVWGLGLAGNFADANRPDGRQRRSRSCMPTSSNGAHRRDPSPWPPCRSAAWWLSNSPDCSSTAGGTSRIARALRRRRT